MRWLAAILILLSFFSAGFCLTSIEKQNIAAKLSEIENYAAIYEAGEINYLQLIIRSQMISKEIKKSLDDEAFQLSEEDTGNPFETGLSAELVQEIFGTPTRTESWVWVKNDNEPMYMDTPVPMWEKKIYEGSSIIVYLNAYPQIIIKYDKELCPGLFEKRKSNEKIDCEYYDLLHFYDLGINVRFKAAKPLDVNSAVSEISGLVENYYSMPGNESAQTIAQKIFEFNSKTQWYLEENKGGDCRSLIMGLIGEGQPRQSNIIAYKITVASSQEGEIKMGIQVCPLCEWKWFNIWPEINLRRGQFEQNYTANLIREYENKTLDELKQSFEERIIELGSITGVNPQTVSQANRLIKELSDINELLNRRYNDFPSKDMNESEMKRLRDENYNERILWLEEQLSLVGSTVEKDFINRLDYEKRLIEKGVEHINTWCDSRTENCGSNQMCAMIDSAPACVDTLGGDEICDNGADDDNDMLIDCQDPDCQKRCNQFFCGYNMYFNEEAQRCECQEGFWDCDGNGDCESNYDCFNERFMGCEQGCKRNSFCDFGQCICEAGFFDCDSDGNCESDISCDQLVISCGPSSYYEPNKASCICAEGYYDCNRDMADGCESTDSQCSYVSCAETEVDCFDAIDNDCDLLIDKYDPDCEGAYQQPETPTEESGTPTETSPEETIETPEETVEIPALESEGNGSLSAPNQGLAFYEQKIYPNFLAAAQGTSCSWENMCPESYYCSIEHIPWDVQSGECIANCNSQEDCGSNMDCSGDGKCNCNRRDDIKTAYFDCNNDLSDGCESTDATCGGRLDLCSQRNCSANMYCEPSIGDCTCETGFYDCDGSWANGCESNIDCGETRCSADSDCAQPECEWNKIRRFACREGGRWFEEKGVLQLTGSCDFRTSGEVSAGISLNVFGPEFEGLNNLMKNSENWNNAWCAYELESLKRERLELQNSMNDELYSWFFEEIIANKSEWQDYIGEGIGVYWKLLDNAERTVEKLSCLGLTSFPEDYLPINASYEGGFGTLHVWEKRETVNINGEMMEVLSPFMEMRIMPPKDKLEDELLRKMFQGEEMIGPSKREIEDMKQTPIYNEFMAFAEAFGGEAKFIIQIDGEEEIIGRMMVELNPEDVILFSKLNNTYEPENIDFKIYLDFDFIYNMMKSASELGELERYGPSWDNKFDFGNEVNKMGKVIEILTIVLNSFINQEIAVEPGSALVTIIFRLQSIINILNTAMGTGSMTGSSQP